MMTALTHDLTRPVPARAAFASHSQRRRRPVLRAPVMINASAQRHGCSPMIYAVPAPRAPGAFCLTLGGVTYH